MEVGEPGSRAKRKKRSSHTEASELSESTLINEDIERQELTMTKPASMEEVKR